MTEYPITIEVREWGRRTYAVRVDGKTYDTFTLFRGPLLTWSQMEYIEECYREALTHRPPEERHLAPIRGPGT